MLVRILLSIWNRPKQVRGPVFSRDFISFSTSLSFSVAGRSARVSTTFARLAWRSAHGNAQIIEARRKQKDSRRYPVQVNEMDVTSVTFDPIGSVIARKREKIHMT